MLWGFSVPSRISIHRSAICALLILPLGALASGCEGDDPSTDDTSQGGHGAQAGEEPTGGQGGQTSSGGQGGQTSSGGQGGQGGQGGSDSEMDKIKKELESLRNETRKLAEENLTCSKDFDCDAVAFGDKPCGGPWDYLPYSKTGESVDELLETAEELRKLEDQYNKDAGISSDCAYVVKPETECASKKCVAVTEE